MQYQNILISHEGNTSILKINRPKAMNSLNMDTLRDMVGGLHELIHRPETKVIVITGEGDKAFVAGADIAAMREMTPLQASQFAELGHMVMHLIEVTPKPVIAAVNGYALGGGTELAISCDIIYASDKATFGLPEVSLGLFPGFGGTQRLARLCGRHRAKEMIFTGKKITAKDAFEMDIVNKICPDKELMKEVMQLSASICANGLIAVGLAKKLINGGADASLETALLLEKQTFPTCFTTDDCKEGLAAFVEKRTPNFTGK